MTDKELRQLIPSSLPSLLSSLRGSLFMRDLALVVFLHYTAVWAVVSTLPLHVTRQLHFTTIDVAWMLSGMSSLSNN